MTWNTALKAIMAILFLGFSSAAAAQTSPEAPADAASYGPIAVCISNYAVMVNEGEAAQRVILDSGRVEQVDLIDNSARRVTFRTGAVETATRPSATDDIRLPSGLAATRYSFDRWEGYRAGIPGEAVWSSEPAHREYQLPAGEGRPPIIVQADIFANRTARADRAVLSRIVPRASVDCATLAPPAAPGAVPAAAIFTPQTVEGPVTFCSGQLGIALRAGERVRILWLFDQRIAPMWILQDEGHVMQIGGGPPSNRPVPSGPFLQAGFTEFHYPDGTGSAWNSTSGRYAFGDGSPLTLYISHNGAPRDHVDAVMSRLAFFRNGEGCDVQAMPAP